MTGFRLADGGLIDRSRRLAFTFDGRRYQGFAGDTLASALLASGMRVFGRSFKYHRPRGVVGAGCEEPNALVELREGARREPNLKATTVELYDGLVARSQNRWPSLAFDLLGANGLMKPLIGAGFYYKTFMWPASFWEKLYEPAIRRAAGLGRASRLADPDAYERMSLSCDLLIVGAGPAGLMAALAAARAGAEVVLCDDQPEAGGALLHERDPVGGVAAHQWARRAAAELAGLPNARVLLRASVAAAYDGGVFTALERVADHLAAPPPFAPRQRFWRIAARRAILAAGAGERMIPFPGNDRPGIMLASAARIFLNRFAVVTGRALAIHTSTDMGWRLARDCLRAGLGPVAILDARDWLPAPFADVAEAVPAFAGARILSTEGARGLTALTFQSGGATRRLAVDALAVSGGFNPSIQLLGSLGARPAWSQTLAGFLAGEAPAPIEPVGGAAGVYALGAALAQGGEAGARAARAMGFAAESPAPPGTAPGEMALAPAFWRPDPKTDSRVFLDLQHDVTAADVALAHREGFSAPEHLKRYTTLGMATDQGRLANVDAIALMAALTGRAIGEAGAPLARPPVAPLAIGAVAGDRRGAAFRPARQTPVHAFALRHGADFVEAAGWLRPRSFPLVGEDPAQTLAREVLTTRLHCGATDVSTLGKIEVLGEGAGALLDRIFATRPSVIAPGRCAYGVMLREDGFVMDDAMIARFAPDRFLVFVSSAHAAKAFRHMLFCRQVLWPKLDATLADVTEGWAQFALAGPKSPLVLQALVDAPATISRTTFAPLAAAELTVCGGVPARLCALSFCGERAFELAVPTGFGAALFERILAAGEPYSLTPYGTQAMGVMRIEKGFAAGAELNGQTSAHDLGLAPLMARDKDHVGRVLSARPALNDPRRPRLVGLKPLDPTRPIRAGAHVVEKGAAPSPASDLGWVSSAAFSPTLNAPIALALVAGGPDRLGEEAAIFDALREGAAALAPARLVAPCFYDPQGARLDV